MNHTPSQLANLKPFAKGESGNPGGRPVGARAKLQGKFLHALADDFEAHGKEAIARCREEDPPAYLRAIVALMPKELEISRPLDDLSDEQLDAAIATVRALQAARDSASGEGAADSGEPASDVSTLREAG